METVINMGYIKVYVGIDRVEEDGTVSSIMGKEAQIEEQAISVWQAMIDAWVRTW